MALIHVFTDHYASHHICDRTWCHWRWNWFSLCWYWLACSLLYCLIIKVWCCVYLTFKSLFLGNSCYSILLDGVYLWQVYLLFSHAAVHSSWWKRLVTWSNPIDLNQNVALRLKHNLKWCCTLSVRGLLSFQILWWSF